MSKVLYNVRHTSTSKEMRYPPNPNRRQSENTLQDPNPDNRTLCRRMPAGLGKKNESRIPGLAPTIAMAGIFIIRVPRAPHISVVGIECGRSQPPSNNCPSAPVLFQRILRSIRTSHFDIWQDLSLSESSIRSKRW